ncbi:L-rhamnulokinase [Pilibacter termitis]|uniref:Rhamnulokinase n=1 Tax=Pilibacter termitis TaxID=263852 RepID=A0A1T4KQH1_9ENTE|nr:rhamnulokinase [Pilibacter termitis]SJZ44664.1 L-rhamnulokinase [Pilibacter termitis]
MRDYIAIDIGASSGRLIHGKVESGKLTINEIHRFKNSFSFVNGHERWGLDFLIQQIFLGLEKAKRQGIEECFIGIDTWAIDYVLLDKIGERLADSISYRDKRTQNKIEEFCQSISKEEIYKRTGIQFLEFNTLYQLFTEERELLEKADKLLLIPDYIAYVLSGKMVLEETNASTTQLLNIHERRLDSHLLEKVGVEENLFPPLVSAGELLGEVLDKWQEEYDLPKAKVITVATHDTASAVVGVPAIFPEKNWAYLSSGTWSLIGIETNTPIVTELGYDYNFTNEWGAYGTYRVLKNIMGLWIVQEIQRLYENGKYTFAQMATFAKETPFFTSIIDVNDPIFTNPENTIETIQEQCRKTGQVVPKTIGELTNCVYSSLVKCYQKELGHIEEVLGKKINALYIVGGGSNVRLLNQLIADTLDLSVYAGPSEATAIGNLAVQMIATGEIKDKDEARKLIAHSQELQVFEPNYVRK